jgi:predicted DNA-binding protein (MmcQ/YjbR family)
MDYAAARLFLLSLPEAVEDFPFGPDTAVLKVRQKMFATLAMASGIGHVNLKCDPDEALALRDIFAAVKPGYHMNKKHWNTIVLDATVPAGELQRMMENSWRLVVAGLPQRNRPILTPSPSRQDP